MIPEGNPAAVAALGVVVFLEGGGGGGGGGVGASEIVSVAGVGLEVQRQDRVRDCSEKGKNSQET